MRRVLLAGGVLLGAALLLWRWPDRDRAAATPPAPPLGAGPSAPGPQETPLMAVRRAEAPASAVAAGRITAPPAAAWTDSFTIDLSRPRGPATPLEVQVLDAATDAPITGALVQVRRSQREPFDRQTTDPTGRAVVSAAHDDDLAVTAEAYSAWMRWLGDGAPGPPGLLPEPGKARLPIEARLVRPAGLRGTVTGPDGEPRASIVVRVPDMQLPQALGRPETATDEQGRYALEVPPGELFRVELVDSGGSVLQREESWLTLASGEILHKDFVLGRPSAVHGRATDPAGAPIPALNVCLVRSPHDGAWQRDVPSASEMVAQCLTGADGAFRFEDVPSGRYAVGPGPQPDDTDPIAGAVAGHFEGLKVDGSGQDVKRDLVVTRGLWITGVVRQAGGLPASGAWIGGRWAGTSGNVLVQSEKDGRFRLGPLAGGLIELYVHHASGNLETSVEAGAQDVELVLRAGGSIRVVIAPSIRATVECAAQSEHGIVLSTTGHGQAEFEGLPPGWYDVIVKGDDGRFGLAKDIQVHGGETTQATIETQPGAWVRVRCDATLSGAKASIWEGDTWLGSAWLKAGPGALETVPAGRPVRVHARTADEAWQEETTITLEAGEIRELVFPLHD